MCKRTNEKLEQRALNIIMNATDVELETAKEALEDARKCKVSDYNDFIKL